MAEETPAEKILRYIDDAIALEAASITGMKDMADEAIDTEEASLYRDHLTVSENQKALLERRLEALGGKIERHPIKDLMNSIGAAATDLLHAAKSPTDKSARNLMQAYAMESLEVAVYEALQAAAEAAGDPETAQLARQIQKQERDAAALIFQRIPASSERAVQVPALAR